MLLTDYKSYTANPLPGKRVRAGAVTVRRLGLQDYEPIWRCMQYIAQRPKQSRGDEIWLLSHKPVFTLGQASKPEHVIDAGDIPVIETDRGGQVTYHGPGQLVVYLLLDVRQRLMSVRKLVELIEEGIVEVLADFGIMGEARPGAPGVYVNNAKIAALGLRIKNGRSYHGLSLNVDMDLEPFQKINPCGYPGLAVTQLADLINDYEKDKDKKEGYKSLMQNVSRVLVNALLRRLNCEEIY